MWPFSKKIPPPTNPRPIFDPPATARLVLTILEREPPAFRVHVLIALHQIQATTILVCQRKLSKAGYAEKFTKGDLLDILQSQLGSSINYDGQRRLKWLYSLSGMRRLLRTVLGDPADEVGRRRLRWFSIAATIYCLCRPDGNVEAAVQDDLAEIYILLADSTVTITDLLMHNAIWKDHEKLSFQKDDSVGGSSETRQDIIERLAPRFLRAHAKLKEYAKKHHFHVQPEEFNDIIATLRRMWVKSSANGQSSDAATLDLAIRTFAVDAFKYIHQAYSHLQAQYSLQLWAAIFHAVQTSGTHPEDQITEVRDRMRNDIVAGLEPTADLGS